MACFGRECFLSFAFAPCQTCLVLPSEPASVSFCLNSLTARSMHCSHATRNLRLVGQVDTAPSHDVKAVPNLTLASIDKVSRRNQTGSSFRSHLVGEFDITDMSQDPALCEGCVP